MQCVTEEQSNEVERVLLFISDARDRARSARERAQKAGGDEHVLAALRDAERDLAALHRRLMQGTYYAVPDTAPRLAV